MTAPGRLVLVGTPIGNLGDLAPRAAEALATADVVCCEDTRRTGKLLSLAGIERAPVRGRERAHRGRARRPACSTAWTAASGWCSSPTPACRACPTPASGWSPRPWRPGTRSRSSPARRRRWLRWWSAGCRRDGSCSRASCPARERPAPSDWPRSAAEPRTVVLYEAPHRVARTLTDLVAACGPDRRVAVARELTKLHEEVWRGTLAEAAAWAADREPPGEIVLVVDGRSGSGAARRRGGARRRAGRAGRRRHGPGRGPRRRRPAVGPTSPGVRDRHVGRARGPVAVGHASGRYIASAERRDR